MAEQEGRRPESDDDVWAQIIAGYDQTPDQRFTPWPVAEDLDTEPDGHEGDVDAFNGHGSPGALSDGGQPADGQRSDATNEVFDPPWSRGHQDRLAGAESADPEPEGDRTDELEDGVDGPDDEDRFVPPTPPPLPELDLVSQLAWGGLIGGPLFLVIAAIAEWTLPSLLLGLAVVAFVAGFVTLVVRMKDKPPDDSDPSNGAVL